MCIGGRDPTTLITPNKAMSFKYFRPTFRKVTTTQKAPAFKNTASAERFADLIDASDILANHSVKKHLPEVNFEDRGHSVLKESGVTRGHSILENSFSEKLSCRDSILGGAGKQNESQFGEDGARAAGAFGKGMAGKGGSNSDSGLGPEMNFTVEEVNAYMAGYEEGKEDAGVDAYTEGYQHGRARGGSSDDSEEIDQSTPTETSNTTTREDVGAVGELLAVAGTVLMLAPEPLVTKAGAALLMYGLSTKTALAIEELSDRPAPDDNGGSEGGFMTWKLQDKLSNGFKNAKDPIINPSDDNQGGGVLTATEADLRNAKDPATNWGDENYNNFVGTIEMNVGEISLKDTATNWGDNYTSTTANVVDTVFAVQDVF